MKKQKNNEKKVKVLKILKYIGLGLCWTILLVGFLALLINGIKGCSTASEKSKAIKQRANNIQLRADNNNDILTYYYFDEDKVTASWQSWQTSVDNFAFAAPHDEDPYSASCRAWGRMNDINGSHDFRTILYRYTVSYVSWTNNPVITLTYIQLINYNTGWSKVVYDKANNIFSNSVFTLEGDFGAIENLSNSTITESETGTFSYFWLGSIVFDTSTATSLTFGDTFNYNAAFQYLVALDVNNTGYQTISEDLSYYVFRQYDGYITTSLNASSYQLTLDLPYFHSNGFLFNQIVFNYVALADTEQVMTLNNGFVPNHYINQQNTTLIYHSMRYKNSLSGLSLQTNLRNGGLDSNGVYYWQLTTSWANDNYKTITFNSSPNEYETYFLNNMNNLTLGGGLSSGGSVFDVFTLLGNAFSSFTSLFNVAVLPSITIGVLVAIPLVVSLIILLFKMIKGS